MIIDTSAMVAIINDEPERQPFLLAMRDASPLSMSTPSALELSLVLGSERHEAANDLMQLSGVRLVEFTTEHLAAAREAHARFGRGSGSPARLNFGDCMSYALAKVTGEALLFKGEDFTHTDVEPAHRS